MLRRNLRKEVRSPSGHQETKPRTPGNAEMAEVIRKQTQDEPLTALNSSTVNLVPAYQEK